MARPLLPRRRPEVPFPRPVNLLAEEIVACRRCPRLRDYLATLPPRRDLSRADYHAAPVPGFGDPAARIVLVGLAPGAHGANRTGRPFTGDGAGDFMYPLLFQAGFASHDRVVAADDGLALRDLYITNAVKCAPPQNKPLPEEFACCRGFLTRELAALLDSARVILCLGREAFGSYLAHLKARGTIRRPADYPFAHAAAYILPDGRRLLASYHTSRYNVQTGRMTVAMFRAVLEQARRLAAGENG